MHAIKTLRLSLPRFILATVPLLLANCTDLYYYGPSGSMSGSTSYLEGYDPGDPRYRGQPMDTNSWWRGDGVSGSPRIVIS
jgi:hypothetical protein